jgi:hypothetical protein
VHRQVGVLVVIQARPAQLLVGDPEAQGLDQVQAAAGVGGQADDVAGVGRDFRLEQDDVEHGA